MNSDMTECPLGMEKRSCSLIVTSPRDFVLWEHVGQGREVAKKSVFHLPPPPPQDPLNSWRGGIQFHLFHSFFFFFSIYSLSASTGRHDSKLFTQIIRFGSPSDSLG